MARNDPYLPNAVNVSSGSSATFDGSDGGTNAAIISGIYGEVDSEIFLEDSSDSGATWDHITKFDDEDGGTTFTANYSTQFNRIMVEENNRRIRVENVDTTFGNVTVDGDER